MASDSDEPLDFPQSDTIPELSSDDSFAELMLKPTKMNTLAQGIAPRTEYKYALS